MAVLPEVDDVEVDLDMNDVRVDRFCSSGPGGQSVNTTYSAIRKAGLLTIELIRLYITFLQLLTVSLMSSFRNSR